MANIEETIWARGGRKNATARVLIKNGTGKITINSRDPKTYLQRDYLIKNMMQPIEVCNAASEYDFHINVNGGGISGQAAAIRHGIAQALDKADPNNHTVLKKNGFLTRDPRAVERKKYGQRGARRKFQFSKR
mgnify:CR=1 FL=1